MLIVGGKRFRPLLMFSVIEALDGRMLPNSYGVALAIECLHTYSLIHDDLPCMDNSPLVGDIRLFIPYTRCGGSIGRGRLKYPCFLLDIHGKPT